MSIFVVGINHKTAPIALREKVYFVADKLALYLQDLLNRGLAQEAVLLSTCNRSELYCVGQELDAIRQWFCTQTTLTPDEIAAAIYVYRDEEAVAHMMSVACGLDSMILGEPQILGQVKAAFSESCALGAIDQAFHRLFQEIFSIAKEIRTSTAIGACPVSVASAAVHFAQQMLPNFSAAQVVLIGAGDTTELLMRYLKQHVTPTMTIVNRCTEKAASLATLFGSHVYGLNDLKVALRHADLVFSATGSAIPLIDEAMMRDIMQQRAAKPMLMMDIAVPRDIAPRVASVPHVKLFCIDDLKCIIESNRRGREHAATKAHEMIRQRSLAFMTEMHSLQQVAHTIRSYRGQIEAICDAELIKARRQLHQGGDPAHVLEAFAHAFTNKLLHAPSVKLRQAGVNGHHDLLQFAKHLFSIPDSDYLN